MRNLFLFIYKDSLKVSYMNVVKLAPSGKHIIPRYLYHLTDAASFEKIKSTGYIKPNKPNKSFAGQAVFTFELQNVLERWQKFLTRQGKDTLLGMLIDLPRMHNLVLLKIPTKNLDKSKLLIRSQDWYFSPNKELPKSQIDKMNKYWNDLGDIDYGEKFKKLDEFRDSIIEKLFPKMKSHSLEGTAATQAPLFKQRGEAIEYIYTDKIPVSNIEEVGRTDRSNFYDKDNNLDIKGLLLDIFKNCRERIAVEKTLK